jgi:hypothetical protein
MKNYLRNFLILALGLMTSFTYAQDWDVDSRTRVDMSGDGDEMSTDQRATIGATWGGSNWGIVVSSDVNYTLNGGDQNLNMRIHEAYASMDIMGYANMSLGRRSLEYGSGSLMGSNDWNAVRNTTDGAVFNIANDMMGLDLGLTQNSNADGSAATNNMFINASKAEGDWNVNVLYMKNNENNGDDDTYMGVDLGYSMMGGQLALSASYNTATVGGMDYDYNSLGATYSVNDNMSVNASMTSYGDNGWSGTGNGNMDGDWNSHGNIGHLGSGQENMSFGVDYDMGGISLSAAMHNVTDTNDDSYERKVSEVALGYSINDNAGVSLRYADDADTKYMWLTVTVTP